MSSKTDNFTGTTYPDNKPQSIKIIIRKDKNAVADKILHFESVDSLIKLLKKNNAL